ncbi:MAG: hypothetical protein KF867_03800 [Cryobacterium sp.]|nr:hypothetical protein [Cryobacterium sp.]
MISLKRYIIVSLAAVFSAYQLLLAAFSINVPVDPVPYVIAMVLYALATIVSLWPSKKVKMPIWMASVNLGVSIVIPPLVSAQLDVNGSVGSDYSTWYSAAIGTLMVITSTRRRHLFAWLGVAFLAVHTVIWAGPGALGTLGVIGSIVWVAVSHILSWSLLRIGKSAEQFVEAEREATAWQAAQEAHLTERQVRLKKTIQMALPFLKSVASQGEKLDEHSRQEAIYLEAAVRDEIRGRKLLSEQVRKVVMRLRRSGVVVSLLDEGGLDEIDNDNLARIHGELASVVSKVKVDRLVVRTGTEESDVAVTVVGLNFADGGDASALGQDDEDQVVLWREIPR